MFESKLLVAILGLAVTVSLTGCTQQETATQTPAAVFKQDPTWLASAQQDDFMFRMTLDTPEGQVPTNTVTVGDDLQFKLKAELGYAGEEPVEIAYNEQLIYISNLGASTTGKAPLLVHPYDPNTLIKHQMKKGDWTKGTTHDHTFNLTAEPGDYNVDGYAAFQVGEKKYRIRTEFKLTVKAK